MALSGMDVDVVTGAHSQLMSLHSQLTSLISSLGTQVSTATSNWHGTDSARFESEWNGTHRRNLDQAAQAIADFAQHLQREIQQQQQASAN